MIYRVVHRNEYRYDQDVSSSYGEAHLHPRETPNQQCYASTLEIDPYPEDYRERYDFFTNRAAHFHIREPHQLLTVTATSMIDVRARNDASPVRSDQPWESARDGLHTDRSDEALDARQYVLQSPAVQMSPAAMDYAARSFTPGRPILDALRDLIWRIHAEFEYRPGATRVDTSVEDLLERRAGVCQDFAHLALAGIRSLGLAGRYVSGYLETVPPAGQPRLQGADASHAWFAVFVPGVGWVEVDPTNDQFVTDRYITIAWGRDYSDVPPLKGVIFTEAKTHRLKVTVDVTQVADDDPALVDA